MKNNFKVKMSWREGVQYATQGKAVILVGLDYALRPYEPMFELVVWHNENEEERHDFSTIKDLKKFVKKKGFKNYDINFYKDKTDRVWFKQQTYENGVLVYEYKQ